MTAFAVDPMFGCVIIVIVIASLANAWMSIEVGKARKKYGVRYPTMYADPEKNKDGHMFNCVQRGHQNNLEQLPVFFALIIVAGLKTPIVASVFGVLFVIGRILYFLGYSSGDPKKRSRGMLFVLGVLGLVGLNIYNAVVMLAF